MSKAVLIMLDGLRPDAVSVERTPALWKLMQRGAYTLCGQSVFPSVTLPCHLSIFHSVPPARHGIMDNDWHAMARPVRGLIEQLKFHERKSAFFYNWEQLRDLNRPGNLSFSYFTDTGYDLDGDDPMPEVVNPYLRRSAFDFTFIYFASIDVAGHISGWMSPEYLQQVSHVDALFGQVLAAIDGDTTVIAQSDHGGHERTHGTDMPEDMTIPWVIAGPGIKIGCELRQPVSLLDTAPTIAYVLTLPVVKDWEGRPVLEAFVE